MSKPIPVPGQPSLPPPSPFLLSLDQLIEMAPLLEGFSPTPSASEATLASQVLGSADGSLGPSRRDSVSSASAALAALAASATPAASVIPAASTAPRIGTIGVCAMDAKVLLKPCRQILNRLIANGEFTTVIFGDKVLFDEAVENWPTCDFLISFFSSGFPLDKAISYANLRKPYLLNDLVLQKALWDRRLVLRILNQSGVPTAPRLEISRDGGPRVDRQLRAKLAALGIPDAEEEEPEWLMVDEDTLKVGGRILRKPFVEKPVDGEDHNVYIYYAKANGGGGRRLFRKIGNKSSEFDPNLCHPRTDGSYVYEQFMDTDNFEDVKAYTVGQNFCHAETRKSPVVDGIVRRNTHGKEIRYVTELLPAEQTMALRILQAFGQTICGFDLLRVAGALYVIDVNGFSFVKDNDAYYDNTAAIIRELFVANQRHALIVEKKQKWVFKGMVNVIRHADRTPKQKFKYTFRLALFILLLKGHREEVIIRAVEDLRVVLATVEAAQREGTEDPIKLAQLRRALEKKMAFLGTKIQLKPLVSAAGTVEKVQLIIKWGGEPTHLAQYQATELGEQMRQNVQLLNREALRHVKVFTSSERRVVASALLTACSFLDQETLPADFLTVRKDLLDDSNAAKDLMDKVKKKLKPLLREGKEAPPQFAWPPKMPEPYVVIQRVVELMCYHRRILEANFATKDVASFQAVWCCGEDPHLFRERWDKLFTEFANMDKVDPSKCSELYDTMKYDALHNRKFLQAIFDPGNDAELPDVSPSLMEYPINILAANNFKLPDSSTSVSSSAGSLGWVLSSKHTPRAPSDSPFDDPKFANLRELYRLAKVLFDFVCPQEYGIENDEKLDIGLLTSLPLSKQILNDITDMRETDTPGCVCYFTKELHIYTLLNVIYESQIPMKVARNALPELDYLLQIVFELYESDDGGEKKHSIRLSMSPGCHTQNPLDIDLDAKHYIGCIPRISLTRHLDMELVTQKLKSRFNRVSLPKKFTPVNISSPFLEAKR